MKIHTTLYFKTLILKGFTCLVILLMLHGMALGMGLPASAPIGNPSFSLTESILVNSNLSSALQAPSVPAPGDQTVCDGGNASFAAGAGTTFQWSRSTDGGLTFSPIVGEISTNLNLTGVTLAMTGYKYRCLVDGATLTSSFTLTVLPLPVATIAYPSTPYCQTGTANVTQTGQTGGTYSSAAGLSINALTGQIDLALSLAGSYTVTYNFTDGTCPNVATAPITINALPSATISYTGSPYCKSGIATVTLTGTPGGTYTSTAGLSLTSSTGAINLAASTPGTYTVTYTYTDGTCTNSTTTNITVSAPPTATIVYAGDPYCQTGNAIVTLTGPVGGTYSSSAGLSINSGTGTVNLLTSTPGTYTVEYAFSNGTCSNTTTTSLTINSLPLGLISYTGNPYCKIGTAVVSQSGPVGGTYSSAAGLSLNAITGAINLATSTAGTYTVTYSFTDGTCPNTASTNITINSLPAATISYTGNPYCQTGTASVTRTGQAGGTYSSTAGLSINSSTGAIDLVASLPGSYVVTYTFSNGNCSGTVTTNVTVNSLPTASISYAGSPYCATGTALVTLTGSAVGTYSSTAGLSLNSATGAVNLGTSTPGTYVVTYSFTDGTCPNTTTTSITINSIPSASISYSGSPYCQSGIANVTQTGTAGGTYSSTAGLSITSSNGSINLAASSAGTYLVTYSFTDGTCASIATTVVTVQALPTATINYAGSPFCQSGVANVTLTGSTGGTYTSSAGLSINAATGAINLAASATGTYTVTYSYTNGTCANTTSTNVTVSPLPSALISYTGNPYCKSGTAIVTQTGQTGGVYSSTAGLSINAATGAINLATSTAGSYIVTYSFTNGACSNTTTTPVTINSLPIAAISYTGSPYCQTGTASVTQTGVAGGTYSSTAGLSINAATGAVNLAASTVGTYTVTYSFSNGTCPNTTTTLVTINALPVASISYTGNPFCQTGTVAVTQTGQAGGTYSSTGGLSINSSTGEISLAASAVGTYTVTYNYTNGSCSNTATTSVTISALPTATIVYSGSPYCKSGSATVTQTGPVGGTYSSTAGLSINSSTGAVDLVASSAGTYTVTYSFSDGTCPNTTATTITISAPPTATIVYSGNPFCKIGTAAVTQTGPTGGTYSSTAGLSINVTTGAINLATSTAGTYTVSYVFTNGTCSNTVTTTVTINGLPIALISYTGTPYCKSGTANVTQSGPAGGIYTSTAGLSINSTTGAINLAASTAGSYTVTYSFSDGTCTNTTTAPLTINSLPNASISYPGSPYCHIGTASVTQTGQAGGTYSSAPGLSIDPSTGAIDLAASTVGTYTVTYNFTDGTCPNSTTATVVVNPLPTATIIYSGNPFCQTGTALVTQTGQAGGTYSSTAGLSINSVTGAINLASSAVGTYTVTYSFANGACSNTTTTIVTVNTLPTATISYAGTPYCKSGVATVTQSGPAGGTYTSTVGLSINALTGAIDLSLSSAGTYTVTYSFSNGTCLNSTTTSLTINPLPTATISYAGNPFCKIGTATVTQTGPSGGTYSSTAGLSINTTTGAINLVASSAGTYTVTYNFTNGTCLGSTTTVVTVNLLPTATITYTGTPYCKSGTANVTQTGQGGGSYSSTAGLSINSSTGAIDLTSSTAGVYTVTYSFTNGPCVNTATTSVTINPLPTATISYTGIPYCQTGTATVTQTGQTGGIYSSSVGLSINASNGSINLAASTPGVYTVTYSFTDGTCSNTTTASVNIVALPVATIAYAGSPYCQSGTALVTQTGQTGGTYSSTAGLSINASTGDINLVSSTPGTYTVTYNFTNGTCPNSATTVVTINPPSSATINYPGSPYCQSGTATVTRTGAPGGTYTSTAGLIITPSNGTIDLTSSTPGTYMVTYNFTNGICPGTTTATVTINALPTATLTYAGNPFCNTGTVPVTQTGPSGGTYSSTAGLTISATTGTINLASSTPGTYSVTYSFTNGTCTNSVTTTVTINALPTALISYTGNPYCKTGSATVTQTGPTGGTYSSTAGLSINASTGVIDLVSSTAGNYLVTYNFTDGTCPNSATTSVTINPLPSAAISYAGSPYCQIGTATVIQTGPAGGTYSSTAGLSINSSTGAIDLTTSTPGNYTVSYNFTNGTCSNTTTTSVIVNPLPVASITYSGNPYCKTGTANVTQTGQIGGTYTSTAGLAINAATGAVNLAGSTVGTYTVTYSFSSGPCPSSTTTSITINALPVATINYPGSPYCKTGTATVTQTGPTGGNYSSTAGLSISPSTGTIDLASSTPGTYSVTYSFSNGTCPNTAITSVTVNPLPTASIIYPGNPFCQIGTAIVSQSGPTGGTYSSTPGLSINPLTGAINLPASTPGTYTVTYSFTNGTCTNTTTTTILISAIPTAMISYTANPYCNTGSAVVLQTGQAGGTYSSTPGVSINPSTGTIDLAASTAGLHTITYNFSNGSCSSSTTASVLINPLPNPTIAGPTNVCADPSGDIYTTQLGMNNYNWSLASGGTITSGSNSSAITVVWSTTGTHDLRVSYTDANGCTGTSGAYSVLVQGSLPPKPDNINGNSPVCQGSIEDYSITPIPGATSYTWSVSNGTYSILSPTSIRVTFSPSAVNGTISVYATNSCGDGPPETKLITVNPKPATPVISASGPTSFCAGGSVILSAPLSAAYLWSNGSTTQSISVSTAGSFTVVVSDAIGCKSDPSAAKNTAIIPNATVFAGVDNLICDGDTYIISDATASNYFDLLWTSTGTGLFSSPGGMNPSYTPSAADIANGSVVLTLRASFNAPCSGNIHDDMTLIIQQTPVVVAGADETICYPGSITVSDATATNGINPRWSSNGAGVIFNGNSLTPTYVPQVGDIGKTITLTLTVDPILPCTTPQVTGNKLVTVHAVPANPGIITAVPGAATVCKGTVVKYSIAPFADPVATYNWNVPAGATMAPGANPYEIFVTYGAASASGDVTVYGTNSCGNGPVSNLSVLVNDKPASPGVINGRADVCQGANSEDYSITPVPGATSYTWTVSNGTFTIITPTSIRVNYGPAASSGTITVIATNGCGTSPVSTKAVTVHSTPATPVITANGPLTFCVGGGVILSAPTGSGYTYLWSNGATTRTINVTTAGNFSVVVTDSFGCQSAASAIVTTATTPAASVNAGMDNVICSGDIYSLSDATASNYFDLLWSSNGTGSFSVSGAKNPTYTPSAADIANGSVVLTLTASNNSPCTGDIHDDMTLTIQAPPVLDMGADLTVCYPASVTIGDVSVTNGINPVWTITSGLGNLLNANTLKPTFQPAPFLGVQTVVLTLTVDPLSPCTLPVSATKKITVSYLPENAGVITAVPGAASVCKGATVSYSITPFGDPSATYHWNVPPGATLIPSANPYEISVSYGAGSSSGDVSVFGRNACGDGSVATLPVQVKDVPANPGSIGGNPSLCQGTPGVVYSITPVPGATGYTWTMPAGAVITAGAGTTSITVDYDIAASSGTISVYATNACGNGPSANKAITVHATPATPLITASGPLSFCAGTSIILSAPIGVGYTYLWSTGATSRTITVSTSGSFNVIVTDSFGCQSAVSSNVVTTTAPAAVVNAGADNTICAGQTYTLSGSASNYFDILWSTSGSGSFDDPRIKTPVYTPSAADIASGFVNLTLRASHNAPCTGNVTDDMRLSIQAVPTLVMGASLSVCYPASVTIGDVSYLNGQNPRWTLTGAGALFNANTLTPTYQPAAALGVNTVTLTLTVDPLSPCAAPVSATKLITVYSVPETPGVITAIPAAATVCKGSSVSYSIPPFTDPSATYRWSVPPGATFVSGANPYQIIVTYGAASASGNVTVYGSNACGNGSTRSLAVTVKDVPVNPGIINGKSAICQGSGAEDYSITPVAGATSYTWSVSNGTFVTLTPTSIRVTYDPAAVNGTISVFATNSCGDGPSSTKAITVHPTPAQPVITAGGPLTFCTGGNVLLTAPTGAGYSYLWSNGATTQSITVTAPGSFSVIITDGFGCQSASSTVVNTFTLPAATVAAGSDANICAGSNFTVSGASATNYSTLLWTTSGTGTFMNTGTLTPTYFPSAHDINTGSVVLTVNATGIAPCLTTVHDDLLLTIQKEPTLTLVSDKVVCYPSSVTISGVTATSYQNPHWIHNGAGVLVDFNTLTPTYYPAASDVGSTVKLTFTVDPLAPCLTAATADMFIQVKGSPGNPGVITGPATVCKGTTNVYWITPIVGAVDYHWTLPAGATIVGNPNSNSISVTFGPLSASGIITVYGSNGCGSSVLSSLPVTVNDVPANPGSIAGPPAVCEGSTAIVFSVTPVTGATGYVWAVPSGATITSTPPYTNSITVDFGIGASSGAVTLTATNSCGSGTVSSKTITVNNKPAKPVITASGIPTTFCEGGSVLLTGAPAGSIYSYAWTGNGATSRDNLVTTTGNYSVIVTVIATGCSSDPSDPITVTVNPAPIPPHSLGILTECVNGAIVPIDANTVAPALSGAHIVWYSAPTGGVVVTSTLNALGTKIVYAEYVDNVTGCKSLTRTQVTLKISTPPAAPTVLPSPPPVCEQSPIQTLNAADYLVGPIPAGTTISWYDAPTLGHLVSPAMSSVGSKTFYAEANDGTCGSLTRSAGVTLTITPAPLPPVSGGDIIECLDAVTPQTFTATATAPAGSTVTWWTLPVGGVSVVPSLSSASINKRIFYAESFDGTCTSLTRTPVSIEIILLPAPPVNTTNPVTICETNPITSLTATATVPIGFKVNWYDAAGNLVAVPILSTVGTKDYYAESEIISSGCKSITKIHVTLTINPAPNAPITVDPLPKCDDGTPMTATATVPSGVNVIWYATASGGTQVTPDPPVLNGPGKVTYYAEAVNAVTGCSSLTRSPQTLEIKAVPADPVRVGDEFIAACATSPVQTLTASATSPDGNPIKWYKTPTGGLAVGSPILNTIGTVDYYAEADNGICKSINRVHVQLKIDPAPAPPVVVNPLARCDDGTPLVATATVPSGIEVLWYSSLTGGTPVSPNPPSLAGAGKVIYYAEARNITTDCRSFARTPQTLEIKGVPADPIRDGGEFVTACATNPVQTLRASATSPDGTPIKWYKTPAGGAAVADPVLNVVGSIDYYAEADNGTCKSLNRAHIKLTISPIPNPPVYVGDLTVCWNDPLVPVDLLTRVTPAGLGIQWFNEATGGEPLDHIPSAGITGTTIYYAGTVDGVTGCQSLTRTKVTVTINPTPADPVWITDISECAKTPVQVLRASVATPVDGAIITWYDAPTGGNLVASPILNHIGTISYWAQANLGKCASNNRTMVSLSITDLPAAPALSGMSNQVVSCETPAGIDANTAITVAPLTEIKWYDKAVNGVEVSPVQHTAGTRSVFAEAIYSATGCASKTRTEIILTINPVPANPVAIDGTECALTPIQTLTAQVVAPPAGVTTVWYSSLTSTTPLAGLPTWSSVGQITYYAAAQLGSCISPGRTPVKLTLNASPAAPISRGDIDVCESAGPVNANAAINNPDPNITIKWFDQPVNGFEVASPILNFVGTVTYYAEARNLVNCPSQVRTAVKLTIRKTPAAPVSTGNLGACDMTPLPTLNANTAIVPVAGMTLVWYDALGNVVASPTLNTINSVTYYAAFQDRSTVKNCESSRTPVTLTIAAAPLATAYSNTPLSPGQTLRLNGGPKGPEYTYLWTAPNGLTYTPADGNVVIPGVIASDAGVYSLTVKNTLTGCSSTVTTSVVILTATATAQQVCMGGTLVLLGWPDNMYSYEWTGPSGFTSTDQNPSIDNVTAANEGVYTLVVTDSKGAKSSGTVNVTINPTPDVFASANTPVCQTAALQLKGGPDDMFSYSWTGPGGYTSRLQNPAPINPAVPGDYILTVIDKVNHCPASDTIKIEILKPKATYQALCLGNTLRLKAEPNGMRSYNWTGPNGFTSNQQFPTLNNITSAALGDYYLTVTDNTGCTPPRVMVTVAMSNPANASISVSPGTSPVCEGTNVTLTGGPASTTEILQYEWTGPNGFSSKVQNPPVISNIKAVNAGLYTLKVTNSSGCSSTAQLNLNVTGVQFVGTYGPYCLNDSRVALNVTPAGVTLAGPGISGTSTAGYTFDPAVAKIGVHPITYTYNNGVCNIRGIQTIEVVGSPKVVTNTIILKSCSGTTGDLTLPAVTTGSTPGLLFTYWTDINATTAVTSPTNVGASTYFIKGSTPSGNCFAITPVSVIQPDSLRATTKVKATDCIGDSTGTMEVNITLGTAPYTYLWNTQPVQTTAKATGLPVGIYTVTVTDSKLCTAAFTDTVPEPNALRVKYSKNDIACLTDENGSARVDSINGSAIVVDVNAYSYAWNTIPIQTTRSVVRLNYGYHTVTMTDDKGCAFRDSVFIDVLDSVPPTIQCPNDIDMIIHAPKTTDGSPNTLDVNLGTPVARDNCAVSLVANDAPEKFRFGRTVVTWTATDQVGLIDTCKQVVNIRAFPTIPQLISPNGDGINDLFMIDGLKDFPQSQLLIYTRSGQLVYQSDDYQNNWDGRYQASSFMQNKIVATGVYYYILTLGGGEKQKMKGYVFVYY